MTSSTPCSPHQSRQKKHLRKKPKKQQQQQLLVPLLRRRRGQQHLSKQMAWKFEGGGQNCPLSRMWCLLSSLPKSQNRTTRASKPRVPHCSWMPKSRCLQRRPVLDTGGWAAEPPPESQPPHSCSQ